MLLKNSQEERVSLECHPVCKRGYNCLVTKTHSMLQDGQCLGGNQYLWNPAKTNLLIYLFISLFIHLFIYLFVLFYLTWPFFILQWNNCTKKVICRNYNTLIYINKYTMRLPRWNSPCRFEGAFPPRNFTQVR